MENMEAGALVAFEVSCPLLAVHHVVVYIQAPFYVDEVVSVRLFLLVDLLEEGEESFFLLLLPFIIFLLVKGGEGRILKASFRQHFHLWLSLRSLSLLRRRLDKAGSRM